MVATQIFLFFFFPDPWGRWSQFDEYFWDGLKPPTRSNPSKITQKSIGFGKNTFFQNINVYRFFCWISADFYSFFFWFWGEASSCFLWLYFHSGSYFKRNWVGTGFLGRQFLNLCWCGMTAPHMKSVAFRWDFPAQIPWNPMKVWGHVDQGLKRRVVR